MLHRLSYVKSLSSVRLFATPWTAARQASLSITNSQSLLKLACFESVMPSNNVILCRPLLPPSIFPSIRVFSNELVLHILWPKYWSFSFSISPSDEYSGLISFRLSSGKCKLKLDTSAHLWEGVKQEHWQHQMLWRMLSSRNPHSTLLGM